MALCPLVLATRAQAVSATWKTNPIDGDWNNPLNWTPEIVPDDVAIFGNSAITSTHWRWRAMSDEHLANRLRFAAGQCDFSKSHPHRQICSSLWLPRMDLNHE